MFAFAVPSDRMQAGRLKSALAKVYNFSGTVCTLGERIIAIRPVRRSHYIRHYATKKRDGCNALLKTSQHQYTLWYYGPGMCESGIDVPKIVYDALPHLATHETEQHVTPEPRQRGSLGHLSPF